MPIREAQFDEIFNSKPLEPNEKLKFKGDKLVVFQDTPEHQERLKEFREKSKILNKLLEEKFREMNLPFSTRNNHQETMQILFCFAPTFLKSDARIEDKRNRYSNSIDGFTYFIHLNDDGDMEHPNRLFSYEPLLGEMIAVSIDHGSRKEQDILLAQTVQSGDLEKLAKLIALRLKDFSCNIFFHHSKTITSITEAKKFFQNDLFVLAGCGVTLNLIKNALNSLLQTAQRQYFDSGERDISKLKQILLDLIKNFKELQVKDNYEQTTFVTFKKNISKKNKIRRDSGKDKDHVFPDDAWAAMTSNAIKEVIAKFKRKVFNPQRN